VNFVLQSLESSLADLAILQAPRVKGRTRAIGSVTRCAVRSVFRRTRREVRRWRHLGLREGVAAALGKIRVELAQDVGRGVSRAVVNVAAGARGGFGHGGVNSELQFVETLSAGLAPLQRIAERRSLTGGSMAQSASEAVPIPPFGEVGLGRNLGLQAAARKSSG